MFQVDKFFEASIKIILANLNNLLVGVCQISVIGSEPHARYLLAALVNLGHDPVLDDGGLDVDGEVPDLEAGLQLEAGLVRGRVHVAPELGRVYPHGFVS